MSIVNELSSDIAIAMFTEKRAHDGLHRQALSEVVLEFHRTLRRLTIEARQSRQSQDTCPPFNRAARGGR